MLQTSRFLQLTKRACTRHVQSTHTACIRHVHYIVQRDTDKVVPSNDIFIRTPDTAPVLKCHDYREMETILGSFTGPAEILTGTFVVNAMGDGSAKMMRKERGVATFAAKVRETTILAVCGADTHKDAYESGATKCIEPSEVDQLQEFVDDFDVVVCTSRALASLRPLGRVLRTKMPHERRGTVSGKIQSAVRRAQLNIEWEMTNSPNHPAYYNVSVPLIRSDFPINTVRDHVSIMFNEIVNFCPAKSPKEKFIERLELTWNQQPIHVDIREHSDKLKSTEVTVLKKSYSREETWALRDSAKNKADFLEDECAKIGEFLEQRWESVSKK